MSLLPPNASPLERSMEAALQVPVLPVPLREMMSADSCPAHVLPWLAWARSVDGWDAAWPESVRRSIVRSAIPVARRKGTVGAVRRAVAAFGGSIAIREWWETSPRGPPHTFAIVLALTGAGGDSPSAEYVSAVIDEVARTKPLRSHFTFTLAVEGRASIGLIAVARPVTYARLSLAA